MKKINKQTFKNIIADELHNKEYISTHQDRFIFITNIVNRYFRNISDNINILDFVVACYHICAFTVVK